MLPTSTKDATRTYLGSLKGKSNERGANDRTGNLFQLPETC